MTKIRQYQSFLLRRLPLQPPPLLLRRRLSHPYRPYATFLRHRPKSFYSLSLSSLSSSSSSSCSNQSSSNQSSSSSSNSGIVSVSSSSLGSGVRLLYPVAMRAFVSSHSHFSTFSSSSSSSSSSSTSSFSLPSSSSSPDGDDDVMIWIPPQYPLPILTPPPHVAVATAEATTAMTASDRSGSSNNNNNNTTTTANGDNHTPSPKIVVLLPPPANTWWQHLQHVAKKNVSVPYQQNIIAQAERLFQAAWQQSNVPEWYGPGRMGRDFRSRHAVLAFHIWLLHKRLLQLEHPSEHHYCHEPPESESGSGTHHDAKDDTTQDDATPLVRSSRKDYNMCQDMDAELFSIFWDNTTCRIRALNVYELSVNKHLENVQKYTFLHLVQYDHCYTETMLANPTERLNHLRQIVADQWLRPKSVDQRNKAYDQGIVLDENDLTKDIEDSYRITCDHIDRIVHYIDAQYQNVMYDLPYDHFTSGHLRFVPLPQFANLHDTTITATSTASEATSTITPSTPAMTNTTDPTAVGATIPYPEYPNTPVPCHPEDVVPHPWVTNITNGGKIYYWNLHTRVSSWIRPTTTDTNSTTAATQG